MLLFALNANRGILQGRANPKQILYDLLSHKWLATELLVPRHFDWVSNVGTVGDRAHQKAFGFWRMHDNTLQLVAIA
ncbi:MAG TPA: hypothetical protein DD856_19100 [Sulfobacillus sp.]|nr:hypothetical protein [Sulfobacillus sp.]